MRGTHATDAVDFHSEIAKQFAQRYDQNSRFEDRLRGWEAAIASTSRRRYAVDLGCGAGNVTGLLTVVSERVLAVDGSAEMVELCRSRVDPSVEVICARLETLDPELFDTADLVTLSSVVEYLEDPQRLIELISERSSANVVLLVSLSNRQSVYRRLESALFRVAGRPRYLRYVKSQLRPEQLEVGSLKIGSLRYMSPAPVVGRAARALRLQRWFDTLVLVELANDPPAATTG